MKKSFAVLAGAAIGIAAFSAAVKAETVLTLSSWLPPGHPIVSQMIVPWAENVKKATDGRVSVQILAKGLGHPKVHFDIAKDGLADVTYSVHGYTPGRFLATKAVEMPFLGNSAEAMSVAYWRVHEKFLAKADEHAGVKLLSLFTHGPGAIHTAKKDIKSVADMAGVKYRIGGGVVNDVATALGTVPLLKPASANYELLSNGVADGTLLPLESIKSFKILDLVPHTTIVPGGLYNVSFFLVMNSDKFNSLSKEDQAAIESVSGEAFAKLAGQAWDKVDQEGLEAMKANGNTVITADDAFVAEIKEKTAGIEAAWVKEINDKYGIDGAAVMSAIRAEVAAYK
ncbi:MAG: TRAP transporter substrate-binding protein [Hyphomicrobiales bacterium]|nr:TRAP transporter substrate-binding protein [Hyphomicrobiales bacterium]